MKVRILTQLAAIIFIIALSVGSALAEPSMNFIVERKAEVPDSFVSPAGAFRCESCRRVLGTETSESLLSKDPDFKQNNMFQTCQGCLDGKMDAQTQIVFAKVAIRHKWSSIRHNMLMDEKFNTVGGVGARELREVKKGAPPRGELKPRGILLVSHTPPARANAGATLGRRLAASKTTIIRQAFLYPSGTNSQQLP
ncbi:MAG: hypothetical protein WCP22_03140 [Chlamydiota bacterium]